MQEPGKLGRPPKNLHDEALIAVNWAKAGLTIQQIADKMNVSSRQINRLLAHARTSISSPSTAVGFAAETVPPGDAQEFIIPRTGQAPLKALGRMVSQASGKFFNTDPDKPNVDWFEILIVELQPPKSPKHVVAITYRKDHRGKQTEHQTAIATDSPATVLSSYDPLSVLVGYPDEERFDKMQRRLEESIQRQYKTLVSSVLQQFPEEVAAGSKLEETELAIFRSLCDRERAQWTFSEAEASLICDACSSAPASQFAFIPAVVDEAIGTSQLDKKWLVDVPRLLQKIRSLSLTGLAALAVSIESFRRRTDLPTGTSLKQAGLL